MITRMERENPVLRDALAPISSQVQRVTKLALSSASVATQFAAQAAFVPPAVAAAQVLKIF